MLIQPGGVLFRQALAKQRGIVAHGIENAALAPDPAFVASAEQAVKKAVRHFFRRQRTIGARPAHVALHGAAETLLGNADLQRTESGFGAQFPREDLVQRWTTRSSAVVTRTGHERAHGRGMA